MKKLITVTLLVGFLFLGCQDNNSVLEPDKELEIEALSKNPFIEGPEDEVMQSYKSVLPKIKYSKNYTMNGDSGGKIIEKHQWNYSTGKLKLEAYLTIPKGAFDGDLTFDLVFNPNLLSMELHPTPYAFNIPVVLDLKFKGIPEIYDIDPENLDFQYYKPNGTFEYVEYDDITWNAESRTLMVKKAKLHHFSRYGWTRSH